MVRLLILALVLATPPARAAAPLVADLSKHLVAISTGFAGTDVLLFGAVERRGDVVVVLRGPARNEVVRRKDRRLGIWVNTGSAKVVGAPSFYHVAATRPLDEAATAAVRDRAQIGLEALDLTIRTDEDPYAYRDALIRLKQAEGLYGAGVADIDFLGNRLFRTEVHFPANVPVGTYLVEVYLLENGEVVSLQTTPLIVSKIGIGAELYDFAHSAAIVYGTASILLALGTGWAAALALRKG